MFQPFLVKNLVAYANNYLDELIRLLINKKILSDEEIENLKKIKKKN